MSRPLAARRWRGFRGHLLVFVLADAFLVVVWAVIDVHGFFWLVFLVAGWGIGGDESLRRLLAAAAHRPAIHRDRARGQAGQASAVGPAVAVFQYGQTRHSTGPCAGGGAREMEEFV